MDTTLSTATLLNFENVKCYMGEDGYVYFLANDVAREIGLVDTKFNRTSVDTSVDNHINTPVYPIWNRFNKYLTQEGYPPTGNGQYIHEYAVMAVAMRMNNDKARAFRKTVIEIIIPYFKNQVSPSKFKEIVQQAQTAIDYYNEVVTFSNNTITMSQIADSYGMTCQAMNALLWTLNFHYPVGQGWVICEPYKDQGLVQTRNGRAKNPDGSTYQVQFTTGYTEKGRMAIDDLLHRHGYITVFEIQNIKRFRQVIEFTNPKLNNWSY